MLERTQRKKRGQSVGGMIEWVLEQLSRMSGWQGPVDDPYGQDREQDVDNDFYDQRRPSDV